MIVADATVLIVLAKMQKLHLLKGVYEEVMMGEVVKAEVLDQGKAIFAPGVEQIEKALDDGWIRVVSLTVQEQEMMRRVLRLRTGLDRGEAESLALALCQGLPLIVDDKEARAMSVTLGIEYLGTAGVLLEAFLGRAMTLEELEEAVEGLSKVMWISPGVVAAILRAARKGRT